MLPVFIRKQPDKGQQIVRIQQWFSGTHHDHMGYPLTFKLPPDAIDLAEHFSCRQIADLPADRARAERAPHGASDLGRDTYRIAVFIPHQHRLDPMPVVKRKQIFPGSVDPRFLYDFRFRQPKRKLRYKLFPQRFGQIRHFIIIYCQLFMQPAEDLLCAETRLPQRSQIILQRFYIHA